MNGIKDFSWSPTDNVVAYWVAEEKDVPASVTLLELPNRNEIRKKNLFNVADCKIHWQKSGDYLCVKVDRYSKSRKEKNDVKYSGKLTIGQYIEQQLVNFLSRHVLQL